MLKKKANPQIVIAVAAVLFSLTGLKTQAANLASPPRVNLRTMAALPQTNCPACQAMQAQQNQAGGQNMLSGDAGKTINLGLNVAGLLSRPPASIQAPLPTNPFPQGVKGWNGQGDLPGAFQRPWEMPSTNFDPSFITPFYNSKSGPINIPTAPWNMFSSANVANGMTGFSAANDFGTNYHWNDIVWNGPSE